MLNVNILDKLEKVGFLIATSVLILVILSVSSFSYLKEKRRIISDIDRSLLVGAASIKNLLPKDFHDKAISSKAVSSEDDKKNIKVLSDFTNRVGFKFLYTLIKKDNQIYITSSNATDQELAQNEQVRYYTSFDEADPHFHNAFEGNTAIAFTHEDRWGTFRALALPEKSPNGRIYLSVAEFDISYLNRVFQRLFLETLVIYLLLLIGAFPLYYMFSKRLRRIISELELAQIALQKSEERFSSAIEASKDGVWDWDLKTGEIYCSPGLTSLLGYDSTDVLKNIDQWQNLIHPEDKEKAYQVNFDCVNGLTDSFEVEYRMNTKDGGLKWIFGRGKATLRDKSGKAVRMVGTLQDITERKQAEQALAASEARYVRLAAKIPGVVFQNLQYSDDPTDDVFSYISPGVYDLFGLTPEEVMTDNRSIWTLIHPEDLAELTDSIQRAVEANIDWNHDFRITTAHEETKWVRGMASHERQPDGNIFWDGLLLDITELKQSDERLRQMTKMEAVGRLAGGVAHDFNNMLAIVIGVADMVLEDIKPGQPFYDDLMEIRQAGTRSADLTRQLLAFARKQTVAPKVIDVNETVESMLKMLQRLIGEDIDMAWIPGEKVHPVKIDPGQVDQILANLCVNARDAIEGIGKVTIETGNAVFDEDYCRDFTDISPGEYVMLAISDNGSGMDAEILSHLFEPFYTTKDLGKGSGLGLATIYGVVKQNEGIINVYSEPGQGTTFRIYLPRYEAKTIPLPEMAADKPSKGGQETVLLVEDELSILKMTTRILERQGYAMVKASTPNEAIRLATEHTGNIQLLITDVVMPEMNGRDLAKNILSLYPGLKCLFMSGYTANVIAHHGVLDEGVNFIQKPFSKEDLIVKIREVLDRK